VVEELAGGIGMGSLAVMVCHQLAGRIVVIIIKGGHFGIISKEVIRVVG
jgi:hypothetical protein